MQVNLRPIYYRENKQNRYSDLGTWSKQYIILIGVFSTGSGGFGLGPWQGKSEGTDCSFFAPNVLVPGGL